MVYRLEGTHSTAVRATAHETEKKQERRKDAAAPSGRARLTPPLMDSICAALSSGRSCFVMGIFEVVSLSRTQRNSASLSSSIVNVGRTGKMHSDERGAFEFKRS
jgi:hypothetical protein